ncbi:hypothetical protein PS6_011722, partial [Mucor atramentarius]
SRPRSRSRGIQSFSTYISTLEDAREYRRPSLKKRYESYKVDDVFKSANRIGALVDVLGCIIVSTEKIQVEII